MARFFDRWFTRNPKSADAEAIIERSRNGLEAQSQAHQATWGFGKFDRWDVDLEKGVLRFSNEDGMTAEAPVEVVGTYNSLDKTFLWAWDHPSIPEERATASLKAREFGIQYGLQDYCDRKVECDEEAAWEYAAVTNYLAEMQGAYRGPSGTTYVFMVFGEVTLSKASK